MRYALLVLVLTAAVARSQDAAPPPSPDESLRRALAERRLKVKFDSTPIDDVLDVVRDRSGVNIAVVASSTIDRRVTLHGNDVSARSVLDAIAAADDGFVYEVWHGFVFVSSKGTPRRAPPQPDMTDEAKKTCGERKLTASFADVTVSEFLDYLSDSTGLSFSAAQGISEARFTLRVKDASASNVIDVVCRLLELKVQRAGEVNVLKPSSVTIR